jgi:nitroreductase
LNDVSDGLEGKASQRMDWEMDAGLTPTISVILSRKSVSPKHLKEPGPTEAEIHLMLQAALAAPDHGKLRPWRVVRIPPSQRNALARVFQAAKLEEDPYATQDDLDKAGSKALNAPTLFVILIEPVRGHAKVTVEEQFIALGAALQNMLLTAHSLGYAAMITSGEKLRAHALQSSFAKTPDERVVAFVSIGTPAKGGLARPVPEVHGRISDWRGVAEV